VNSEIFRLFARILDYPREGLVEALRACEALAPNEARVYLQQFREFAEAVPLGQLQEIYSGTFDFNTICPYVGHYLFGESYKRSAFLVELKKHYLAEGFEVGAELPDHISLILRFLAVCEDVQFREELIVEALQPALRKMNEPLAHPYSGVLQALQRVLQQEQGQLKTVGRTSQGGSHG